MSYFTGMTVRLQVTFTNFSDAETDPTTITAYWKDPSGTPGSSVYASSGTDNWTRVSAGIYYYDLTVTLPGQYSYGFQGTGAVARYNADAFEVRARPTS